MIPPEWFFSTLSQTIATIVAFIITIAAVLHQLERNRKHRRTERLREELIQFQDKYGDSIDTVLEILKQPFGGEIPPDITDLHQYSLQDIENVSTDDLGGYPTTSEVWMHLYHISSIIDNISPSEELENDELLKPDTIQELINSSDNILNNILGTDDTIQSEINQLEAYSSGGVSASTEIFDPNPTGYQDFGTWFERNLSGFQDATQLRGQNLLSIYRFMNDFHRDARTLSKMTQNTIFSSDGIISAIFYPVIALIIFGIGLPVLSLTYVPSSNLVVSGWLLTLYQLILLGFSMILTVYSITALWSEI